MNQVESMPPNGRKLRISWKDEPPDIANGYGMSTDGRWKDQKVVGKSE